MKSYLGRFILLLSIFIMVEFFALDAVVVYHDELPTIADTEWVHENDSPIAYRLSYFEKSVGSCPSALPPEFYLRKALYVYLQPLFYQEKLRLTDGFTFVFLSSPRFNIPHLNRDDEDPAFLLG